ncbi:MAG: pilus assembly protein TadG-related protein [Reyranellales bacterium]
MMQIASRAVRSALSAWHRLRRDESGSVITVLAALPVLAGAVAIGVETGEVYRVKRQMQVSADAAALSASVDMMNGKGLPTATTTAQYEAGRNGFTNGVNGVTVSVAAPTSGSYAGTTNAVQVTIQKSMGFSIGSALLNGSLSNFTISASAVGAPGSNTVSTTTTTTASNGEGCMIALTPNNEQGVSITNFNNFTSDCTVMSNGTATGTGSSASISMSSYNHATMYSVWTRGSFDYPQDSRPTLTVAARTNQTGTIYDSYANLPTPSPGTCNYTNYTSPGGNVTLYPGTYCGGLSVTNSTNVYFTPGTYYIANGDLVIKSDNNVSCPTCSVSSTDASKTTGTTFILTQTTGNNSDIGGVSISSMNNVTLNAAGGPVGGVNDNPYKGILFYQDRRVAAGTMTSSSKIFTVASLNNATLSGAIYFPQNRIDISSINNFGSGSASTACTIWVGRYLKFSSFNNNYKGGCKTYYNTDVPGLATTTTTTSTSTVTKGKVVQ